MGYVPAMLGRQKGFATPGKLRGSKVFGSNKTLNHANAD